MSESMTKVARVSINGRIQHAIVEWNDLFELKGDLYSVFEKGEKIGRYHSSELLPPVSPGTIYGLGVNHRDYLSFQPKLNRQPITEPIVFHKPTISAVGMAGKLIIPGQFKESGLTGSGELAVVMKTPCSKVLVEEAGKYILGYTNAFDALPKAAYQGSKEEKHANKGFPTFCPMGPYLVIGANINAMDQRTYYNDVLYLAGNTSGYIWSVEEAISRISQTNILQAGDVIIMGAMAPTPDIQDNMEVFNDLRLLDGDMIVVETDGLGRLIMGVAGEDLDPVRAGMR
ncbi:fumarylacetoacetate hydrolase family protein [Thermodesulfobacteriota bacterium]